VSWRVPKSPAWLLLAAVAMLISARLAATTPLAVHIHSDKAMFQVLISPGTVGVDSFVLQLMTGEGTPLTTKQATLVLMAPGEGVEPLERKAVLGSDGYWHVEDVKLPHAGRWHMRIDAVTLFKTITLEDDFEVPGQ
jgi:copper transport protein